MVISDRQNKGNSDCGCLQFTTETVDRAIARINGKKQQQLGFTLSNTNGDYHKIVEIKG
jgi:hypothetical protein